MSKHSVNHIATLLALGVLCVTAHPDTNRADHKPFIECGRVELVQAVPELAGIQFETSQDRLDGLLQAAGDRFRLMFTNLVGISATEEIHEMRFENSTVEPSRRELFRYGVRPVRDGTVGHFEEIRTDPNNELAVQVLPKSDFVILGNFFRLLRYLLPETRDQSRFRYLGRWTGPGQDYFIVAFAQRPDGTALQSNIQVEGRGTALLQGIVWIDSATNRAARLRLDLLGHIEDSPFNTLTTDISLAPINFPSIGQEFLVPARVTVHVCYGEGDIHTVHRYSDYRLSGVAAKNAENTPTMQAASAEDPWELLDRGVSLAAENKRSEAIAVLKDAVRLNPDMSVGQYQLAATLRASGDLHGAEEAVREALKRAPKSGPAHNLLGILLFRRGNFQGAVTEFRDSTQCQPTDGAVHFNLAQALEKLGDRDGALEEYRTAATLAPDDAAFKERYEQRKSASNIPSAVPADTTIKVQVRQVLVPVIVTDKEGHHVTGLTQPDFSVFEDGVEQKISGFSVEDAGVVSPAPSPAVANAVAETPQAGTPENHSAIRRTYLICVDSFHSAFANLVHVRDALSRLFHEEKARDSQYVVVSVGTSTQMLQGPTTNPADVLRAVESKDFQKVFLGNGPGSTQAELRDFRRTLDETRAACDYKEPGCEPMKRSLPAQANQLASRDRILTLNFLSQFRSLVQVLARGTERRSIILLSDGFQLVPGKEAFDLLATYFPEMRSISLRSLDRIQDLEPILHLAANNNVPIYTIDSRGLYTPGLFDASDPGSVPAVMPAVLGVMNQNASGASGTLSEIAAATGGTAFQNSNNILNGLERAFADGRQYYVLAYVPSSADSDGKFHSISVRVRESKMVVSAKRGYWASSN